MTVKKQPKKQPKKPTKKCAAARPSVPTVAVADVMAWEPCGPYTESRVRELFGGRLGLTGEQILDLDIPVEDRMWAVVHSPLLSERAARLLAADVAEHVQHLFSHDYPGDGRPRAVIDAARRFARGEIAAITRAVAGAAAWAAAWAAARAAARDAAGDAAWSAAWDAAWDAEREWQITICRGYLRAEVSP